MSLAELLLETGRRPEAEALLRGLIDDYNGGRIPSGDGAHLASVGRAAWLLGSARDANDALEEAEAAGADDDFTHFARAEVFLETHDPGHAGEVLEEILAKQPSSAEGLARMAEVRIAANLDLDEAARLARRALETDPRLGRARAVLAGLALRDQDFTAADREIELGLAGEPGHLDLLSLRATRSFLADDRAGFREARRAVLARDPEYSRLYRILGEHLDWAHRYEEAVELLREALLVAPDDARVRAELGIQLIRGGEEEEGVRALARAFSADPFNVRAWNTLRLYEKHVPASYETREHGAFRIRYPKAEAPLLDRHVPAWLADTSRALTRRYDFTPKAPIGVELYPEREHFAVRTSGLPTTAIQGVCFGRTLAAMSPRDERFNLGMTLWHELSHVYHLQLSRSRVPRWFTEGLAEYETLVARPEWARELDRELDRALAAGRVPGLLDLNLAFSRAEDVADMATAYYASTHVVAHLAERHGMPALRRMLVAWAEGKSTREVLESSTGRP
ncbi:MAG: hypothetical protein FJ104_17600, partial [Deltaproteobacteria bacterium]|nr:hypothetical protein [Deltaproteobacteria bacterium]